MARKMLRTLVWMTFAGLALPAYAQAFRALGFIDENVAKPYSKAYDVSGDGSAVAGESNGEAFRLLISDPYSLESLGYLSGASDAQGISNAGEVVVGFTGTADGSRAYRWTAGSGVMTPLGVLDEENPFAFSSALDVSADGSVVIGRSTAVGGGAGFRWTVQSNAMMELALLPAAGKDGYAISVSADGDIAVGRSGCCDFNSSAVSSVLWDAANGFVPEDIGDLEPDGTPWSAATGISADGQVVVGGGGSFVKAYRWSGGIISELTPGLLPPPMNSSAALDASGDGTVIVGTAKDETNADCVLAHVDCIPSGRAFVWTSADGMRDVRDLLVAGGLGEELTNWRLEAATGVSDDGNILVGFGLHNGVREAWLAALSGEPFPSTPPDDDDDGGGYAPWRHAGMYFGIRESHGFLWHPDKGPIPIDPDPAPFLLGPAAEGGARWVQGSTGPRAVEELWAVQSTLEGGTFDLRMLRYDGADWNLDWSTRGAEADGAAGRVFAVAYEGQSGEALAVYAGPDGSPVFRTFVDREWSDVQALEERATVADAGIGIRWMEVAARPGTDEIAIMYLDALARLHVRVWNGSRWLDDFLATGGGEGCGVPRCFDLAYESLSGNLNAVWSAGAKGGVFHAIRDMRTGEWSEAAFMPLWGQSVAFVDLASDPVSNRIAGAFKRVGGSEGGATRLGLTLSIWDANRWRHRSFAERAPSQSIAPLPGAIGWVGTSGVALFLQGASQAGVMQWVRWRRDHGWRREPVVVLPSEAPLASLRLESSTEGGVLALLSDADSELHVLAYDDVDPWRQVFDDGVIGRLAAADTLPFEVALTREQVLLIGDADGAKKKRLAPTGVDDSTDLLSFVLVPRGDALRVQAVKIALKTSVPFERGEIADIRLVVDKNGNGVVDDGENETLGGIGSVDSSGEISFLDEFQVSGPTHLVLQATIPPSERKRRLALTLKPTGVSTPAVPVRGGARQVTIVQ